MCQFSLSISLNLIIQYFNSSNIFHYPWGKNLPNEVKGLWGLLLFEKFQIVIKSSMLYFFNSLQESMSLIVWILVYKINSCFLNVWVCKVFQCFCLKIKVKHVNLELNLINHFYVTITYKIEFNLILILCT